MGSQSSSGALSEIGIEDVLGSVHTLRAQIITDRLRMLAARHALTDDAMDEVAALIQEARRLSVLPPQRPPRDRPGLELLDALDLSAPTAPRGPDAQLRALVAPPTFSEQDRYRCLEHIGSGGMGDVYRVWDQDLGRVMAMKILRVQGRAPTAALARFLSEARVTARLEHPGIVPIHDVGQLDDGRYYFTMKEVRGRSLSAVIREVHSCRREGAWPPTRDGWSLRRLVDTFHRVCVAVAYAHDRGVIHRDLKPSNIMVGEYGETLVLDWGLAYALPRPSDEDGVGAPPSLDQAPELFTDEGGVIGTPAYMPPEQAAGATDQLGPDADVYALGAMLYQILAGHPPYRGEDARDTLRMVLSGPPPPPGRIVRGHLTPGPEAPAEGPHAPPRAAPPVPEALRVLCLWAMARNPRRRPTNAGTLAEEVRAWLEGEERQRHALAAVREADSLLEDISRLRAEADIRDASARVYLSKLPPLAPIQQKRQGWQAEDEAQELRQEAELLEVRYLQSLRAALNHDPDQEAAHARLAAFYHDRHLHAEADGDQRLASWAEALLREHDRAGAFGPYLEGHGSVTLMTSAPGVEVTLFRYVEQERRLVAREVRSLGRTPILRAPLLRGSYLLELSGEGLETVRLPVYVRRSEAWNLTPPGGDEPLAIPMPPAGALGPEEVYVPPGWFISGGDAEAPGALPRRRLWVDGFIIHRAPISNRDYLIFLNDLARQGRLQEALAWAPRERNTRQDAPGELLYALDERGRFGLGRDAEGDAWHPDEAVVMIDWQGTMAYAAWLAARTGLPWRLPSELEWEKAARGADGRTYPWGDFFDPNWACTQAAFNHRPRLPPIDSYPTDTSPYGVRGMAGNVCDWCLDAFSADGPAVDPLGRAGPVRVDPGEEIRVFRGGSFMHTPRYTRAAVRTRYAATGRGGGLGFRLARAYPT